MPDIAIGALIAGVFVVIGGAITGIITYNITGKQVQGALKQLRLKLEHSSKESRVSRTFEVRKRYLFPLGEVITRMNQLLYNLPNKINELEILIKTSNDISEVRNSEEYAGLAAWKGLPKDIFIEYEQLAARVSDKRLVELMRDFVRFQGAVVAERASLYKDIDSGKVVNPADFTPYLDKDDKIIMSLFEKLLVINKRIEVLLCDGD